MSARSWALLINPPCIIPPSGKSVSPLGEWPALEEEQRSDEAIRMEGWLDKLKLDPVRYESFINKRRSDQKAARRKIKETNPAKWAAILAKKAEDSRRRRNARRVRS